MVMDKELSKYLARQKTLLQNLPLQLELGTYLTIHINKIKIALFLHQIY